MDISYFDNNPGHADKQAVQTLSREVSRIITEQVKKSLPDKGGNSNNKETRK